MFDDDDNEVLRYNFDHKHPWHRALARELSRALRKPVFVNMRRLERLWPEFAGEAMDFIIDVDDSTSFWGGYEAWNLRHFGVALPVTEGDPGVGLSDARLHHFVWKQINIFLQDYSLSPDHPDILTVVGTIRAFWEKRKSKFNPCSDSSAFLSGPIQYGYQAKDRLVILGQTSYFFRTKFAEYVSHCGDQKSFISECDDFLCQSCSQWSGMGPIDLLAEVLNIPDAQREDLRSWSERHAAPFRIDSLETGHMFVTNLVTEKQYRVDWDKGAAPIPVGTFVFGFLARWDGGWRWSGVQSLLGEGESDLERVKEFVQHMRLSASRVLCRYWPEYKTQAMEMLANMRKSELEFLGGRDLVHFESGKALAESTARFLNEYRDKRIQAMETPPDNIPEDFMPETVLSETMLECEDGVALFLNPEEGDEMMLSFDNLIRGLQKNGDVLTQAEHDALRGFIESDVISPAFVRRVLQGEPDRALGIVFGVGDDAPAYWLDWLLRCWKGEFYRPRYPNVSVV